MNLGLASEILEICKVLNYECSLLSNKEYESIQNFFKAKYSAYDSNIPLWQYLDNCISIQDSIAWMQLDRFINGNSYIIFFDLEDDPSGILVQENTSIVKVLEKWSGFIYYVTDVSYSYLICFNDHDFLIGCDLAGKWIQDSFNYIS